MSSQIGLRLKSTALARINENVYYVNHQQWPWPVFYYACMAHCTGKTLAITQKTEKHTTQSQIHMIHIRSIFKKQAEEVALIGFPVFVMYPYLFRINSVFSVLGEFQLAAFWYKLPVRTEPIWVGLNISWRILLNKNGHDKNNCDHFTSVPQ